MLDLLFQASSSQNIEENTLLLTPPPQNPTQPQDPLRCCRAKAFDPFTLKITVYTAMCFRANFKILFCILYLQNATSAIY